MNKITPHLTVPRVLHLVPGFHFGGIESLLMSLYRGLNKDVMQFDFMVDTCDELPEFTEIRNAGGRVFQMGRYLDSPVRYQRKLNEILRKYGRDYVALHSHTVIRALPVLWAARRHNIPKRILHSHTDSLQGSRLESLAPLISKATLLLATDYWACSEIAGRFFFRGKDYKVFSNTIRTGQFAFNPNDRTKIREQLGIKKNNLVIGHTGRFTHQKNHVRLIEIFAELYAIQPDAKLILVGKGPLEIDIKKLVVELAISEAVIFVGLQLDVAPYLSAMDIFLLPSHYEGFCISLLEAQANGLPCLASNIIPDEVQITPSVMTCNINDCTLEHIMELHNKGRADSASNIELIGKAGYDSDLRQESIIAMYLQ